MRKVVCGLIGSVCSSATRTVWNKKFSDARLDAFFDFYRTKTLYDLELRLSEMFLLERRGYVVAQEFQMSILPLLDRLDAQAKREGRVDTVTNRGGILIGSLCDHTERRMDVWFPLDSAFSLDILPS